MIVACMAAMVVPSFRASATTRAAGNGQGTLVVVGDSLTEGTSLLGSLPALVRRRGIWTAVTVDHRRGRTTAQGTRVLAQRLARAKNPTAVVVALGTNDMMSRREPWYPAQVIDEMMNESMGLPVLWVNINFSRIHPDWRSRAARFNRALLAARAEWPNLRVADWSRGFVPAGRSNYIGDGVHLTTSGYRTRAVWLDRQIAAFGRSIVDASTTTTAAPTTSTTIVESTTTVQSTTTVPATSTMPPVSP